MKMPSVSAMLQQKMTEIQSRIPLAFKTNNNSSSELPFEKYIETETEKLNNTNIFTPVSDSLSMQKNYMLKSNTNYMKFSSERLNELMPEIENAVQAASQRFNIDPMLVMAVIKNESSFQPNAVSKAGAQGLMQLMPGTSKMLGVTNPFNITQNINGGTQYLSEQLKAYDNNLDFALAAYNAGPGSVNKYNGVPPYAETQSYVKKVKQTYLEYLNRE